MTCRFIRTNKGHGLFDRQAVKTHHSGAVEKRPEIPSLKRDDASAVLSLGVRDDKNGRAASVTGAYFLSSS